MSQKEIDQLKDKYKTGVKIKLLKRMVDEKYSVEVGEIGIVDHVDDIGTIHVRWESGSGLGLIPNVDEFEIVDKIKVIVVEVGKEPYVKEIYNTLKDMQEMVGGLIDRVPTFFSEENSYDFVFNDEGKMMGLPLNRYIFEKKDAIAGNFMVVKGDDSIGEYINIEDEEIDFLLNQIKEKCPKFDMFEYLKNQREEEEIER